MALGRASTVPTPAGSSAGADCPFPGAARALARPVAAARHLPVGALEHRALVLFDLRLIGQLLGHQPIARLGMRADELIDLEVERRGSGSSGSRRPSGT
jgi:hypothetical protein